MDLTYDVDNLGDDISILKSIEEGNHPYIESLKNAKNPMIIMGTDLIARSDGEVILALVNKICQKYGFVKQGWNGYNLLQKSASRVGALDLGFVPEKGGKNVDEIFRSIEEGEIEVVYLLGVDEIDMKKLGTSFVIYQGHHGDRGAHRADVVLPGAAYTEKNATYVNTEGRAQRAKCAVSPPGDAKEDRLILQMVAHYSGINLPYESLAELRLRMQEQSIVFANMDDIVPAPWCEFGQEGKLDKAKVTINNENYYMSDPITRVSKIMAECSKITVENKKAS
jgi:NADH-quinone oxidoreductase subunit G